MLLALPGRMPRKEASLLWHPEQRLRRTMLTAIVDGVRHTPTHESTTIMWDASGAILIRWDAAGATVDERLSVSGAMGVLSRNVRVTTNAPTTVSVEVALYANPILFSEFDDVDGLNAHGDHTIRIRTSHANARYFERFCTVDLAFDGDGADVTMHESTVDFQYSVDGVGFLMSSDVIRERYLDAATSVYVREGVPSSSDAGAVQQQLEHSRRAIRAAVSLDGRFNASLFQYEFEWGMDAAMVARAATVAGDIQLAAEVLDNILTRLSNDNGMIAEAGRFRGGAMSELNGNGAVLDALGCYWHHSRDDAFIRTHWTRIAAIAEYPLGETFAHESGLLVSRRDFWERYPWMGVGEGFELAHQVFCSVGLAAAAELAEVVGDSESARRWREASQRIRTAALEHPTLRLIDKGVFIRRRRIDGSHEVALGPGYFDVDPRYTPYIPAVTPTKSHRCEPDTTEILPIIYGWVAVTSDVAVATIESMEWLWSPTGAGGYARYNIASEPDSPGPWPFATAMVAAAESLAGMHARAQRSIEWLLATAGTAGSWLEYYGTRESPPFPPTGIIVWGWAQFIILVVEFLAGIRVERDRVKVHPRSADTIAHRIVLGAHGLSISIRGGSMATIDGVNAPLNDGGISIELPLTRDHVVEFT